MKQPTIEQAAVVIVRTLLIFNRAGITGNELTLYLTLIKGGLYGGYFSSDPTTFKEEVDKWSADNHETFTTVLDKLNNTAKSVDIIQEILNTIKRDNNRSN